MSHWKMNQCSTCVQSSAGVGGTCESDKRLMETTRCRLRAFDSSARLCDSTAGDREAAVRLSVLLAL